MAKPEIPDLVVSVDLGGSLTKVVAATATGERCLLALASEVSEIPQAILKDVQSGFWGDPNPETLNWVGVKEGASYALGVFARKQFKSQLNLSISKTELAVPKILSLLWVLQQKFALGRTFYARLGVLLPAGECSDIDIEELQDLLIPALKSFDTPTGKMTVKLFGKPIVKPEGGGVFLHYKQKSEPVKQQSLGILGIGYRNANLLICNHGTIGQSDRVTSDLGFYSVIQRCKDLVGSTVDEVELAIIVARAGYSCNSIMIERYLQKIGKARRLEPFIEAIEKSKTAYWSQLLSWFKLVGANRLDNLVLYGGTAEYFKEPLSQYFKQKVELSWHSGVIVPKELLENAVAESSQTGLEFRFIDCWCFSEFICQRQDGYEVYGKTLAMAGEV